MFYSNTLTALLRYPVKVQWMTGNGGRQECRNGYLQRDQGYFPPPLHPQWRVGRDQLWFQYQVDHRPSGRNCELCARYSHLLRIYRRREGWRDHYGSSVQSFPEWIFLLQRKAMVLPWLTSASRYLPKMKWKRPAWWLASLTPGKSIPIARLTYLSTS